MRTKIRTKTYKGKKTHYVTVVNPDDSETSHGGHRLLREAKAAAHALETDAGRGRYVRPDELTVRDYFNEWLESRENADISPNWRATEETIVKSWLLPNIGDEIELQKFGPRDIVRLYSTIRKSGGRGGKPLSGKSLRNSHSVLSKAMGDAVRRGHILTNPVLAVDPPAKTDSIERVAWTLDEVHAFLDTASRDRLAAIWRLALSTGARRGELLGICWVDTDFDAGTITIRRQVLLHPRPVKSEPRVYVRETTKSRRPRTVRVDGATVAALRRWKATQTEERLAFGPRWHADAGLGLDAAVVTEPDGLLVHPDTLLRRWKALVKKAGVTPIVLHGARHSYAELALAAGVRLDVVSRQLGHASISTTANIYTHDNDAAASEAAEIVGRAMEGR